MPHETVASVLAALKERLTRAGVANAGLDARLLVQLGLHLSHEDILASPRRAVGSAEARRLEGLASRREAREPFSRIAGTREFFGRSFAVTSQTLDPRADTEALVEMGVRIARDRHGDREAPRLVDLGTGTGAVAISLLAELPRWRGVASDVSAGALQTARANAESHGVVDRLRFIESSWLDRIEGPFHIIVSNPPYVASGEIEGLQPEVSAFEPRIALDGGTDGLDAYRAIAAGAARALHPEGHLCMEIGEGQEGEVRRIMAEGGLGPAESDYGEGRDLAGKLRVLTFRISAKS